MTTAAVLCLLALWVDSAIRFDPGEGRRVRQVELAPAIYGVACAIVSLARGAMTRADRVRVACCMTLFVITVCVATLLPRVIHN